MIELLVVVGIIGIVSVIALPQTGRAMAGLRLRTDGRNIANTIALTKMRAASAFSRARLQVNTNTRQYFLQVWDKTSNTWQTEGATYQISSGVGFGFGSLATPPPNTQVAIHQSPACKNDAGDADIPSTACVIFNSRGIPIDDSLSPYGENGLYITDGTGVYVTTITATPLVRRWWSPASVATWVKQ